MANTSYVDGTGKLQNLIEVFNTGSKNDASATKIIDDLKLISISDNQKLEFICANIDVNLLFSIATSQNGEIYAGLSLLQHTELVNKVCQLLDRILSRKTSSDVFLLYGKILLSMSHESSENVVNMCLHQILRLSTEQEAHSLFMSNPEIITYTIHCIGANETSTSSVSGKILNNIFRHSEDITWLFSDDIINVCKDLLSKNSVIQFRMYEVFVDLISLRPEYLEPCSNAGIFNSLFNKIKQSSDILVQLNALDLVSKIAVSSPEGLKYVEEKSILEWIKKLILSDDPLACFIIPGAIKFFGVIAAANPANILPESKSVTDTIFENLNSNDAQLKVLCAETISHIATSSSDGLKILHGNPDQMKTAVQKISTIVSDPGQEEQFRKRSAEALANIFSSAGDNTEVSMILEKLFRQIDQNPISYLFNLAKQPFNLRYNSLQLLASISKYSWSEQDIVLCAGFMEYLLDRKTESEKVGHELKYDIIKNLAQSSTSKDNIGVDYNEKVTKYYQQGPFYSESIVAVTYERED